MNHTGAAKYMADLILSMTNPSAPRWEKERIEIVARSYAKNYVKKTKEEK